MPLGDEYPDYPGGSFQPQAMLQPRNPAMMAPPAMAAPTGTTLGNEIQPRGKSFMKDVFPIIMQGLHGFGGSISRQMGGGGAGPDLVGQVQAAQLQQQREDQRLAQEQEALKMKRAQFAGQQMNQLAEIAKLPPHMRKAVIGPWVETNKNAGFPVSESMVGMIKSATAEEGAAYSRYVRAAGLDPEELLMTYGSEAKAIEHTNKVMEQTRKAALDAEVGKVLTQHQGRGGGQGAPVGMPSSAGLPMGGAPPMAGPPQLPMMGVQPPPGMQVPSLQPPGGGFQGAPPMPGGAAAMPAGPDPDDLPGQQQAIKAQLQEQRALRKQLNQFAGTDRGKDAISMVDKRIADMEGNLKSVATALRDRAKSDEGKGRDQIATSKFEGKWRQLKRENPGMTKLDAQREAAIWTEANYGELPPRIHALFADKPDKPAAPQHLGTRISPSGRQILSERIDGKVVQTDLGPARNPSAVQDNLSLFRKALVLKAEGKPTNHPDVVNLTPLEAEKMIDRLGSANPLQQMIRDAVRGEGVGGATVDPQAEADGFLKGRSGR